MCENNTKNKKIVSVFLGNKLCNVASRLRNKGIAVKCPYHNGHCTANLAEDAVIGNDTEYSKQCTTELNDALIIANIITDGDSKSFNGVNNAQGRGATQLRDIRHLANSMKRAVQNCTFSLSMFAGQNINNMKRGSQWTSKHGVWQSSIKLLKHTKVNKLKLKSTCQMSLKQLLCATKVCVVYIAKLTPMCVQG